MDSQPVPQPDKQRKSSAVAQSLKRAFRQQEGAITSIGELLLPTVLGAMEACWIDALLLGLANARVFGTSEPLVPLWTPFVFLVGMQWLLLYLEQRFAAGQDDQEEERAGVRGAPVLFVVIGLFDLLIIWIELYSPAIPLYDLRWLGTLVSDILFLSAHFYQAVFIVALSFLLSWRGLQRAGRVVEPSTVMQTTWLGLGCIIAVILVQSALKSAGVALQNELLLFLLIPCFLLLALAGHALARISFIRQSHETGLQGSVVAQERAVLMVIGMLGLGVLIITALIGLFANRDFFAGAWQVLAALGKVYDWLVALLADLVVILVTPFVWLLQLYTHFFPPKVPQQTPQGYRPPVIPKSKAPPAIVGASALIPILKVVLPILLVALIVLIFWLAVRRRRKLALRLRRRDGDIHESLWTWALFLSQVRAILRALLRRFLPEKEMGPVLGATSVENVSADPGARSIRDIYRLLLRRAAAFGVARKKDETPYEFQQRLHEKLPQVEPQLGVITEAYAMVRYGGSLPNADDLAYLQGQWIELNQKWV